MTRTFEQMAAERDPLYAAMQPHGAFLAARILDEDAAVSLKMGLTGWNRLELFRDAALLSLAIKALRHDRP